MFTRGDIVRTHKGASFEGEIVSVFQTRRGKLRCVVEATEEKFDETLHVYPVEQLVLVKAAP